MNKKQLNFFITFLASVITIFVFITGFDSISAMFKGSKKTNKEEPEIVRPNHFNKSDTSIEVKLEHIKYITNIWIETKKYKYILSKEYNNNGFVREVWLSPMKSKICFIKDNDIFDWLVIMNIDSTNIMRYELFAQGRNSFDWIVNQHTYFKNITWLSDNKLKLFMGFEDNFFEFRLDQFKLADRGDYILTLDKYNSIVNISKYKP